MTEMHVDHRINLHPQVRGLIAHRVTREDEMPINAFDGDHAHVSIKEAAALASVRRQTIHQWIAYGRLQPLMSDDGYRLDLEELNQFLTKRRAAATVGIKVDTLIQWTDDAEHTSP